MPDRDPTDSSMGAGGGSTEENGNRSESWVLRTRAPRGQVGDFRRLRERDDVEPYFQDAAHYPGGWTPEVCFPSNEAEVAAILREGKTVLAVGAQSSLTGGATPRGDTVVSTARMASIHEWLDGAVRVGPGLLLAELGEELERRGLYYPPVPTYDGASVGGTVATNAAGAATFKYGTTRDWINALTVVLADGEVLELRRGRVRAHRDGYFELESRDGSRRRIDVPRIRMPAVAKCSSGYFAAPGMDAVDLFVGAEGTLGVVTEIELRLLAERPAWFVALVPLAGDREAVALVSALRAASVATWNLRCDTGARDSGAQDAGAQDAAVQDAAVRDAGVRDAGVRDAGVRDAAVQDAGVQGASGVDVAAMEFMDARCIELLREDGVGAEHGVALPEGAGAAVLLQAELPAGFTAARAYEELAALDASASAPAAAAATASQGGGSAAKASGLQQLCRILSEHGVFDRALVALPGEDAKRRALFALREGVPEAVNRRIGAAQRSVSPKISKCGGDVIVPFDSLAGAVRRYRGILQDTGLDHAIWGHISDGNMHPNFIPRSEAELEIAREAQLEIGRVAIELGGCPMSEHGTGRSAIKKQLLRELYGDEGVAAMMAVKRALDPDWILAPGLLWDAPETTAAGGQRQANERKGDS